MATKEDIESYLIRTGVEYEEIEEGMWVVRGEESHVADVVIRAEEPIVVFRMKVMELPKGEMESFLRHLLTLNAAEMLHAAFGLENEWVVVGGAQQLENLDYNEFQAMLDDIYMAITTHFGAIKEAAGA